MLHEHVAFYFLFFQFRYLQFSAFFYFDVCVFSYFRINCKNTQVVAIIPKNAGETAIPKLMGTSRKYVGPIKYPVTPVRAAINGENQRLSLLADDDEQQVYI